MCLRHRVAAAAAADFFYLDKTKYEPKEKNIKTKIKLGEKETNMEEKNVKRKNELRSPVLHTLVAGMVTRLM